MACEMCGRTIRAAYWHQTSPVDRDLCLDCAHKDQKATHPREWKGRCMVEGGYMADYSPLTPEELARPDPEYDNLIANSRPK